MTLAEKRAERMKLVTRMRQINDAAASRAFTPEETEEYNRIEGEVDTLGTQITEEEGRASRADRLRAVELSLSQAPAPVTRPTPAGNQPAARSRGGVSSLPEYRTAFNAFLEGGPAAAHRAIAELRVDTLQAGLFTLGGALQLPQEMVMELLQTVDNAVFVRQYARKYRLEKPASLGIPTLDTDIADFDWTTELLTGNQGDLTFGKRELIPHPCAKRVKVSKTLARVSAIPIAGLVQERLGYKRSITEEKAFLTGPGVRSPLGIFTASTDGVPTSQDVSTDNTTTAITFDGLMEAAHFMKEGHRKNARWIFHRDAIKKIRKLKDSQNQYLWAPAVSGGIPSTILNIPYDESEYVPNTFTTGLYVGALCNWAYYSIVDALDMTIQVLGELYAETNQDAYLARFETDGAPVLAEAFVRVKLA